MKGELYRLTTAAAEAVGEFNDCAVRALAIAGRVPYEVAHAACAKAGRENRHGTMEYQWRRAARILGLRLEPQKYHQRVLVSTWMGHDENGKAVIEKKEVRRVSIWPRQKDSKGIATHGYTLRTIGKLHKRGYYLVMTSGHLSALVNGRVEDHAADTRRRVIKVIKVVKPRKRKGN